MANADDITKVDAYIARSQPFAVPILIALRALVLAADPELSQTLKWGMPCFMYKDKMLCNMAGFKAHATFGFWHGELVTGKLNTRMEAMGSLGRLTSTDDLPSAERILDWVTTAKRLIDDGVKPPHMEGRGKHPKPEIAMSPALQAALGRNAKAKAGYDGLSPSCRREYLEWIAQAKRQETCDRRIKTAIELLEEGKKLNWKYEKC